ncbi:MAG TPA: L-histidine N(alpha)-methyltransferase [Thermoanaerobaculia bacterium]|nr:L-histidine N(alpha)-methyltransferase [Thermoanaerobaculia bacterium]
MSSAAALSTFAMDVARDLALSPRQLQSKYLYDRLGSRLFEAICRLPWYTITRAELGLLSRHADEIAAELPDPLTLTELGPGDGEKIALLAAALVRERSALATHLIDISQTALDQAERRLGRYEGVSVVGHRASYEEGLRRVARARNGDGGLLVLFLGSNLGNFDRDAARDFLRAIRGTLRPGDALLLGADLVKPEKDLVLAYDDPLGVTAAFDKNLLLRINRELDGNFDLEAFAHRAVFDSVESRVEMRLVSLRDQEVEIPAAGTRVRFAEGDYIWTESSYKYTAAVLRRLVEDAGFACRRQWVDSEAAFALALFSAT